MRQRVKDIYRERDSTPLHFGLYHFGQLAGRPYVGETSIKGRLWLKDEAGPLVASRLSLVCYSIEGDRIDAFGRSVLAY